MCSARRHARPTDPYRRTRRPTTRCLLPNANSSQSTNKHAARALAARNETKIERKPLGRESSTQSLPRLCRHGHDRRLRVGGICGTPAAGEEGAVHWPARQHLAGWWRLPQPSEQCHRLRKVHIPKFAGHRPYQNVVPRGGRLGYGSFHFDKPPHEGPNVHHARLRRNVRGAGHHPAVREPASVALARVDRRSGLGEYDKLRDYKAEVGGLVPGYRGHVPGGMRNIGVSSLAASAHGRASRTHLKWAQSRHDAAHERAQAFARSGVVERSRGRARGCRSGASSSATSAAAAGRRLPCEVGGGTPPALRQEAVDAAAGLRGGVAESN